MAAPCCRPIVASALLRVRIVGGGFRPPGSSLQRRAGHAVSPPYAPYLRVLSLIIKLNPRGGVFGPRLQSLPPRCSASCHSCVAPIVIKTQNLSGSHTDAPPWEGAQFCSRKPGWLGFANPARPSYLKQGGWAGKEKGRSGPQPPRTMVGLLIWPNRSLQSTFCEQVSASAGRWFLG